MIILRLHLCLLVVFNIIWANQFHCTEIPCSEIKNHKWLYVGQQKTCYMKKSLKIDEDDSTISPQSNEVNAFNLCWSNNKVLFLPIEIHESFPELIMYRAQDCSITTVAKEHFENLSELKVLLLGENGIEMIPPGVFDDLTALEHLNLRK